MIQSSSLRFQPLTREQAETVLSWRYTAPFDFYNPPPITETVINNLLQPEWAFHGIVHDQEFIGYASFGADGQLPGGDYQGGALDIGLGLRPDLTGAGWGPIFVAAIMDFARTEFQAAAVRVTVAAFNERAIKVYHRLGFVDTSEFRYQSVSYRVLVQAKAHQGQRTKARSRIPHA